MVTAETRLTDAVAVKEMGKIVAAADLANRADLELAVTLNRGLMEELLLLCDPKFRDKLEWLADVTDETYTTDTGREVKDKVNELYRYIIGIQGRVKMAKDIAAANGATIPLQRKVLGLEVEQKNTGALEAMLRDVAEKGF